MEKKGSKMKIIFEVGGGKNDDFTAVFSYEISRISEYKMETAMKK